MRYSILSAGNQWIINKGLLAIMKVHKNSQKTKLSETQNVQKQFPTGL